MAAPSMAWIYHIDRFDICGAASGCESKENENKHVGLKIPFKGRKKQKGTVKNIQTTDTCRPP